MSVHDIDFQDSGAGKLYVSQSVPHAPGWAWFLTPLGDEIVANLRVASASAILVVSASGRYFAVCFGHGYANLNSRFVEARFGLRTCLNTVDSQTIRSLDKRTFDSIGKLSHEQSTRPVRVSEFGIDIDRDLLRSVVGQPVDPAFGSQIAGKDAVSARVSLTANKLPKFLARCLAVSKKDTYKKNFEFIDNISEATDPEIIDSLNELLVQKINDGAAEKTWMAVPDAVNWATTGGFKYSNNKKDQCRDDIRLKDFLERWEIDGELTVDHLQKKRILQFDGDESTLVSQWSAHHCLYSELEYNGEVYILSEGAWYNVNKDFVASVNQEIGQIDTFEVQLEQWGDENEGHYNERVCGNSNGHFALMDRKMIFHGGGSSSIEFCDLMSVDRKIIHVKHYSGSSVLSHLFHQGTVSALMTAGDIEFRQKVNEKLPGTHQIPEDNTFNASDFEVVYAIGTREPLSFELPFFSKVSLRNSARQLRVAKYRVSLATIQRSKVAPID